MLKCSHTEISSIEENKDFFYYMEQGQVIPLPNKIYNITEKLQNLRKKRLEFSAHNGHI